jgi:hypothetical protein
MIEFDLGGACPRQKLVLAIGEGLGLPTTPGPGTDALNIGTMDYPSEEAIEMVARAAMQARQDTLMAMFADQTTQVCAGLALIYRTREGARVMEVEPCRLEPAKPLLLVTRDRRSAFALDERCILSSRSVPSRAKIERGVRRAWEDICLAMRRIQPDPDAWEAGYFTLFGDAQSFADFMR